MKQIPKKKGPNAISKRKSSLNHGEDEGSLEIDVLKEAQTEMPVQRKSGRVQRKDNKKK